MADAMLPCRHDYDIIRFDTLRQMLIAATLRDAAARDVEVAGAVCDYDYETECGGAQLM